MASTTNVDPNEIRKFEELASRWWDKNSEFKPLHDINPLRANWIDNIAPVAEKKVLDVGCGGGILSEALAQRGADVTGIDMGDAPLGVAKLHQLESGLSINSSINTRVWPSTNTLTVPSGKRSNCNTFANTPVR